MKMIIGGAFQGKMDYARGVSGITKWLDGAVCEQEEIFSCQGICHFEEYIRRFLLTGMEKEQYDHFVKELAWQNPELVIVSTEVGYGIVPVDANERSYRERVGRVCTELAAASREVHRVVCGIGMVIKHD